MNKFLSSILLAVILGAITLSGTACGGEETAAQTSADVIKPMSSYQDEAAKAITSDNAEAELKKMMAEVDSDSD
jgi:outer membrane lipoprotein-sorting protein